LLVTKNFSDSATERFQQYGEKDFWIGLNFQQNVWNWTNPNANCGANYTNWNPGI
jgi:hypothetical protein